MPDLKSRTARLRLKPRGSAYTQVLAEGRALAYRKRTAGHPGRWMLRTAKDDGGYGFEVLGVADDIADADGREVLSYPQALGLAVGKRSADPSKMTVGEALTRWARAKCHSASSRSGGSISRAARDGQQRRSRKTLRTITAPRHLRLAGDAGQHRRRSEGAACNREPVSCSSEGCAHQSGQRHEL